MKKKNNMKKNVNEAYPYRKPLNNNSGKKKRYIKIFAKRLTPKTDDAQTADPNAVQQPSSEVIQITLQNVDMDDAKQIQETVVPNAKVFMGTANTKSGQIKVPTITFTVPDKKFAKWLKLTIPKIQTVFENSNNAEYPNVSELDTEILEKVHSTPSEETTARAEKSLKEMEEAIYKAISENRWDDAMVIYKKAINLMARVYGHQLSPNNVKSIYKQAEAAGISPSDKGAATNSYWPDGTEKFWPTFVRSAQSWRKDFGRTIKDEPKMQYAMASGFRKNADTTTINNRLKSQGHNSLSDVSLQQKDKIKNGGIVGGLYGVGYDISDTEGPAGFFDSPGLLNNLDGTLTDAAVIDNDTWMKKLQDMKNNNPQMAVSDDDKKREMASSEEGQAEIFLSAIKELCSTGKYDGGWEQLNVTIVDGQDPITNYLLTIQNIAKAKLIESKWKNQANIDKIAEMVTAAVALCTVGKNKISSLGYNFQNVGSVFGSFEECKSSVLSVTDSILSALHRKTSEEDKNVTINENHISKFFNLLERMENRYNENYKYELTEGLIHRPSDEKIMSFLGELGLEISNENESMETFEDNGLM